MLKTNDLQNIIYTSLEDDINGTNSNLYLFVPSLLPSVETQSMFNEATQINYKISYKEYYTERRIISDQNFQVDIGSTQQVNSPKYLIGAHQTRLRTESNPYENNNISIFDYVDLRNYSVETDGQRYPRESVVIYYKQNDYNEQYKGLKVFFKEHVGEELMTPFISYPDMKTKYPIEIKD